MTALPGRLAATALALALVAVACTSTPDDPTIGATGIPTGEATSEVVTQSTGTAAESPSEVTPSVPTVAYQSSAVSDVVAVAPNGSTFRPADFAGKHVFVETFATWCSKCRQQLGDTNQAAGQVGDNVVFLVLSVETNLDPAVLRDYAASHGFDNLTNFGVLTDESLSVLVDAFGRSVANAPSTPKFTIGPNGAVSELTTGFESVEEILAQIDG